MSRHDDDTLVNIMDTEWYQKMNKRMKPGDSHDEELIDVFETDAYAEFKKNVKPGDYVRIYRENAGLSQAALAEKFGVGRSFICDIEHHRREISKHFAKELSDFYKVSPERFITWH